MNKNKNENELITNEILKELGWHKDINGNFRKDPYPFVIYSNDKTKEFHIFDRFFPSDTPYHSDVKKILTLGDYDDLVIPLLKEISKLNNTEKVNYQINSLINSYNKSIKISLEKITNLDQTVKENQIRTFINESFKSGDDIFKIRDLNEYLNIQTPNGNLLYLKSRLTESDDLFCEIEKKVELTKQYLKDIYRLAQPTNYINDILSKN